ncbi:MAG: C1 family peptidase [Myxococcota bacterium]
MSAKPKTSAKKPARKRPGKSAAKPAARRKPIARSRRKLDARPDTLDFRDRMYVPTLVEVPETIPLSRYARLRLPVLDQGTEGACTGFGLAAVANYLLWTRRVEPRKQSVSPRMFYTMARRYDEWPGERYEGSSARGAIKGWHKHGVCSERLWPYRGMKKDAGLTDARAKEAGRRSLGAYYRVNHKDLVAMHAALAEVGVLFATAVTHDGWDRVGRSGLLPWDPDGDGDGGGHAFAIVAYDDRGFWFQNSWSKSWGRNGFARIGYDDWLAHGSDVWVARLGVPIELATARAQATTRSAAAGSRETLSQAELRPHVISLGNDGRLRDSGPFGTSADEVREILRSDLPRITRDWKRKRILLYAHGGLVGEESAIQRLADYRAAMLESEVYPISFVWKTDYWTTLTNMLQDALKRRRSEGALDSAKDFMLDRLDDALEPIARALTGKAAWDEMKENAARASIRPDGGARIVAEELARLARDPKIELHVAGHSAGSIFHAPFVQLLATDGPITKGLARGLEGQGLQLASTTLWAPACTTAVFKQCYLPLIQAGRLGRFALFTLGDEAEQDDHCARIYNKSLLYLVSNAFEERPRIPLIRPEGIPILGMQRAVEADAAVRAVFADPRHAWILAPNNAPLGDPSASRAKAHGAFDDDEHTVRATLARILGARKAPAEAAFAFEPSASSVRGRRQRVEIAAGG